MSILKKLSLFCLVGALLLLPPSVYAQETIDDPIDDTIQMPPNPAVEVNTMEEPSPLRPNIENSGALKAYIDGVVTGYMQRDNLAGVTISIVQNNEVLYTQGYGASNLKKHSPVSPSETLFRIGSISKTFVWTALMQLQEAGKLSLDDTVNQHLPSELQLPTDDFENPILISHLMNHTLGYEDNALGHLFVIDETKQSSLKQYLINHRPAQVREAGASSSYSNYGASLAGFIVEHVSGQDFDSYVEDHIFTPLGMNNSSFREPYAPRPDMPTPINPELAENFSTGFAKDNGRLTAQAFEFIQQVGPAGAMSSTALDMSKFMQAHLNYGEYENVRILEEQTAKTMQQPSFRSTELSNGFAHGFIEYSLPDGYRGIGHGGATLYFISNMVLVPELGLGIFISSNTNMGFKLAYELPGLVVERFFTDSAETTAESAKPNDQDLSRFMGNYLTDRHSYEELEKILALFEGFLYVDISSDGYLTTSNQLGTTSWAQLSPLHFKEVDGYKKLAFGEDEDGNITHLYDDFGVAAATKVGFLRSPQWFGLIFLFTFLASLGAVIGAWLRRNRHVNESLNESVASRLAATLSFVWLLFFVFFFIALAKMAELQELNVFSFPPTSMKVALAIALVALILTLLNLPSFFVIWRDGNWPTWRRIRHSFVIIFSFSFVLTLYHWNLIGFHYY